MSLRSATSSRTSKSSPHSTGDMKQNMAIHTNSERVNDFELSNLTSVLDRLHEWEKKLYKEVKVRPITQLSTSCLCGMQDNRLNGWINCHFWPFSLSEISVVCKKKNHEISF